MTDIFAMAERANGMLKRLGFAVERRPLPGLSGRKTARPGVPGLDGRGGITVAAGLMASAES